METRDIVHSILTGGVAAWPRDEDIDAISNALKERRSILRRIRTADARAEMRIGSEGTLTGLSPKYLNGMRVRVSTIKKTRVGITFVDAPPDRFSLGGTTVPAQCIILD